MLVSETHCDALPRLNFLKGFAYAIGVIYFCEYLTGFTGETDWAWSFPGGRLYDDKARVFNEYRAPSIFSLSLSKFCKFYFSWNLCSS